MVPGAFDEAVSMVMLGVAVCFIVFFLIVCLHKERYQLLCCMCCVCVVYII